MKKAARDQAQEPGMVKMDRAAAEHGDGWVTDTTPNPEPQHVIDRNARESEAALQPRPGQNESIDTSIAPERPLAPGVLESSTGQMVERAEAQEAARRAPRSKPR